jgi:hypothetical protein
MSGLEPESRNVKHNRRRNDDRRQNSDMPSFPFKDSSGATIRECRRKIPDRRINDLQVKRIDETVIS